MLEGSLRSSLWILALAVLLTGCAGVVCPADQLLKDGLCVCSSTLEPPIDGICIPEGVCDSTGCSCTLEGLEAAITLGGTQVLNCEEGAAAVKPSATIVIDNDLALDGQGHLIVQGDNRSLLFEVGPHVVELTGVTITRGDQGLHVLPNATAILTNSVVSENTSMLAPGGGIRNEGTLTLVGTTVEDNFAAAGSGGGIYNGPDAALTLTDSKVIDNEAAAGPGGGVANDRGTLVLNESEVSQNTTGAIGDARYDGGGISSADGSLVLTDSVLRGNEASGSGGGIAIIGGSASLTRIEVFKNESLRGGGVDCSDANVTVANSSVLENTSSRSGGGVRFAGAELVLSNSTVARNAADPSDVYANVVGGGVEAYGGASVTIVNSTIHENSASSLQGGGLYLSSDATMILRSTTISRNAETGITNKNPSSGSMIVKQTIIENGCELENGEAVTSEGYNIESPGDSCGLGDGSDEVGVSASALDLADALADNGGDTWTLLPGGLSEAVDAFFGVCDQPADQRGVARPQGDGCDIGAVEVE